MAADRASVPKRRRVATDAPKVTYALMIICAVVYAAQWVTQYFNVPIIDALGVYHPGYTDLQHGVYEPWRMLTSVFLHGSPLHLAFNVLTLWIFGRALEPLFGRLRFALLFLTAGLGGSLAVALISPNIWVVGASGAVFGLFGAWFVVLRRMKADMTPMLVLIGINVVVAFLNEGIAWEAHLGGLVVGALCGWLILRDHDKAFKTRASVWAMIAIAIGCVVLATAVGALR